MILSAALLRRAGDEIIFDNMSFPGRPAVWCGCLIVFTLFNLTSSAKEQEAKSALSSKTTLLDQATNRPAVFKSHPKSKPTLCQKLNPVFWFGNMDDPRPPEWYRPKNRMRTFLWYCRNPFHNFFFYVIGVADKEIEVTGWHPGRISNPEGGWNWSVCHYRCLRLPLISYKKGRFNFYLGWRPHGNFGIKLNFSD
ncbi:MAG: hypothetical protein ABJC04_00190 [Verrucomicrobiota bacterium]